MQSWNGPFFPNWGHASVRVAVLDGYADLSHSCFRGSDISLLNSLAASDVSPSSECAAHGAHVASVLFGQHDSEVQGMAPNCSRLIIPIYSNRSLSASQLDLARAIEMAADHGAHVINISGGQLTDFGEADVWLHNAKGPYADQIYEILLHLLNGQIQPEDSPAFVERVSIPGMRTGGMVELFSRAKAPVVALADVRGLYGWRVNALVDEAVNSALPRDGGGPDHQTLRDAIADFLHRVYYELRNYGVTSRDRAMNFTATNCVQAASAFAKALVRTVVWVASPAANQS